MHDHTSYELWHTLHRMELAHWHDVNLNDGKTVHELYTEYGRFTVGTQERLGREAIRAFYESRRRRGIRTARHLVTNFLLLPGDDDVQLRAAGTVCLHAGDQLPLLDSKPPILIADLINEYVLEADDVWRYASHLLCPIFIGDDAFVRDAVKLGSKRP